MNVLIVTGFSGAGKSIAVNALEDIGYYCIDNLPPEFIMSFLELAYSSREKFNKLAIVSDIRGGDALSEMVHTLNQIKEKNIPYKILFLEARQEVLSRRFKETRRKHPLMFSDEEKTIEEAILKEQEILQPLYEIADYTLDTSILSTAQLKENIVLQFAEKNTQAMTLKFTTFGFKYGIPQDADIVFDVRCLPNPFYIPELKEKTGYEKDVVDYIFSLEEATELFVKTDELLHIALPLYIKEGKSQLTIAIGCTGGKHRSVAFAEKLSGKYKDFVPQVFHRDIGR
jgi:Predicted P-loop-containing kinase